MCKFSLLVNRNRFDARYLFFAAIDCFHYVASTSRSNTAQKQRSSMDACTLSGSTPASTRLTDTKATSERRHFDGKTDSTSQRHKNACTIHPITKACYGMVEGPPVSIRSSPSVSYLQKFRLSGLRQERQRHHALSYCYRVNGALQVQAVSAPRFNDL